jgi:hypothetical protein
MYTLGTHFDELLKNTRPPQERLNAARDLPPKVRDYLAEHEEFGTVDPHSRLAGSYAQKMSTGDVKDVDFLVRLDGDPEKNEPEAKQVIGDLKKAMDGLPDALDCSGEAVTVERGRRSVHVYLEEHDFHLDAVPCIAPDGFDEVLWVPDRGWNKWVPSHPIGYIALLEQLNAAHGKKVKKLGRLLKHFRDYQMKTRKPKSYWLGALLIHQVQDGKIDTTKSLAECFRDLLDSIYGKYACLLGRTDDATPNIPDPMLGHNVSWNWSRTHFQTFMRRLNDGRTSAANALEASERDTAIEWWQKVFGEDYFPSQVQEAAACLAAAGLPGLAAVAKSGLILPAQPASSATPSLRTKFHGAE